MELNEVESVINQCEDVEGSIVVTATENDDIIGAFVQPKIEKSVVDNTAEINDIKNKNKSFNQDSNLFEANVLDFADWLHASNETAIYDMLATFYKVEIFTDRNTWYPIKEIFNSLKVHEYYEPLIRRWLKALETEGYVVKNDKNQYRIKKEITRDLAEHSWEQWLKVDSKVHYNDLMMNFFGETRTNLLPLLRGKLDPIDLFFPKGSFKVALAAYKDNIVSKCTNRVVVEDMLVLVKHFTKKYPQKQFRILEIGAGVGGVSIDLIEALKIYNVEYLFTDISRSFLNEAQERFKKYPWVKFGLYDINIDYWKQDIPTSYFDVILCNNVLHNANNEVKVLGQFKEIAAPNGNLIIIDATGNNYALMTSIEFLNGLNGVEDFRAENEQIFLQQDQWNKLFKKSDIELLAAFPEEDSTLKVIGQTVFVCKFNSKRRRIDPSEIKNYMANNLPEYMLPSHIEVLKEFPLTANGKIDRNILRNHLDGTLTQTTEQGEAPSTDLEKAIAQIWCDALKKEKIWKNENFYEIGGDSLLVAQVVAKMKEKIEEAKAWDWDKLMIALIESPTIEGISKKLMEGLPSEETKEKQESLIILKQGNNNKALVLIHDGTGTISPYNQVIPFLHSTEGSLLALQCNDMEEYLSVKPEKLIQFLGEKYAKILIDTEKEVYDLVGYCMGGLIALETAKILTEAGKTVHSLISVDTTPSRRMVNNELLMERAFGMIIGADTYKVGHTVEDELLKRAIKELGEKYGDNVSNEELVSLASVVCEHNIDYIDTFGIGIDKEELYNYESTMIIGAGSFPGLSGILPVWIRKEQQESEIRRVNIFAGGNEHITASACADFLLSTFSQFGKIDSYYSHQQIKKTENITERVPLIFPDTAEIMEYLPDEIYLSAEYSRIDELHWYNVQTNSEYRNIIQEALLKLMISQEYEYVNRLAENVKRKLENKREESKTWYRIWLEIETVTEKKNYGYEALDSYKINGRIAAFCAEALCSGICQKGIYWPFEILDAEIVMNSLINEEILIGLKENDKKMQEHDLNYEEGEL